MHVGTTGAGRPSECNGRRVSSPVCGPSAHVHEARSLLKKPTVHVPNRLFGDRGEVISAHTGDIQAPPSVARQRALMSLAAPVTPIGDVDPSPTQPWLPRGRPGHAPLPWVADICAAFAGLGLGATLALVITGETRRALSAPGGWLIAGGRLAGFTGAYLMLVMVAFIARLPWLKRRWARPARPMAPPHRALAARAHHGPRRAHHARVCPTGQGGGATPAVGLSHLLSRRPRRGGGVRSARHGGRHLDRIARRRLKYETWWIVHLYTYLALALAFAHQIVTGGSFIGHPLTRAIWIAVWLLTAGMVIVFRVALPIGRNLRHRLRVAAITEEPPGVFSVICSGRHLQRLAVSGGQFFQWRFLTRGLWRHAHPYSLSALPRPPYVRVTVKGLGDQSSAVAHLRPGTRVVIEGPYGAFTHHACSSDRAVLIGAGVGITPLRALLEDLPPSTKVTVIVRASTQRDIVHRDEIVALVDRRQGNLHEVIGAPPRPVRRPAAPAACA